MNDLSEKSKTPATKEGSQPNASDDIKTMPLPVAVVKLTVKAQAKGVER
ncbi:MAG TPA: hypothetical protein VJ964_10865 [Balneolaceae bacterium]|nr:hypothetical protein [Balneolaceae bacterium]